MRRRAPNAASLLKDLEQVRSALRQVSNSNHAAGLRADHCRPRWETQGPAHLAGKELRTGARLFLEARSAPGRRRDRAGFALFFLDRLPQFSCR